MAQPGAGNGAYTMKLSELRSASFFSIFKQYSALKFSQHLCMIIDGNEIVIF